MHRSLQLAPPALVVPRDPQPIEDRCGVPKNSPSRTQVDRALEMVIEGDRSLANVAVAKEPSNHEEFKVESKPLDREKGHGLFEHATTK